MAYNQTKLHVNLYVQLTVGFIKSRVKFSFLTTHSLNNLIPRFALLRLAALGLRKIASLGIRLLNSLGQKTKFHSRQNGSHCFLHIQVNKNHFSTDSQKFRPGPLWQKLYCMYMHSIVRFMEGTRI